MDYRRAHLSTDICLKRISRDQAINELKIPPWNNFDYEADLEFISIKLGYKKEQLKKIMRKPNKWYVDYPNRKKLLCFLYDIYRFLTLSKKATNF